MHRVWVQLHKNMFDRGSGWGVTFVGASTSIAGQEFPADKHMKAIHGFRFEMDLTQRATLGAISWTSNRKCARDTYVCILPGAILLT